jgi:mRNA interferase MazF
VSSTRHPTLDPGAVWLSGPPWWSPATRLTANIQRDYPTNIRVTAAESGLPRDTVFLAFQLRSLDHSHFAGPAAGFLSPTRMEDVANALRLTLEL